MRLRDILAIINESLPIISNISFVIESSFNKVDNIGRVYNYFTKLSEIEALKKDIDLLIKKHPYLISEQVSIYLDRDTYNDCKSMMSEIINKCNIINKLLTQIIKPQNEYTISFKLYKFENFSEFLDFCNDLNKKILVPLNKLNIDIQLGELEAGSDWISIVFGIGLGVVLITAIVRQAFDILIHDYQKLKAANSLTEILKMGKEFMKEYNDKILEYMGKKRYEKVDQIIEEIKDVEGFPSMDDGELSELKTAIKLSMESFEKHIDKGLEVYKALDIKDDERYRLPDFTKLLELKQPQKLLSDGTEGCYI